MGALKKATLEALTKGDKPEPVKGTRTEVQFNPTTLRIQLANNVDAGPTTGRQTDHFINTSAATLTLDLVFDTADEGSTDKARDVREETAKVARFFLPTQANGKLEAPPKVRFHWGSILFDGVMTTFSEDLDYFSSEGIPLRAKVSVTIKEQNSKLENPVTGDGPPQGGATGTSGTPSTDRTGTAIGGETAADFAVRMGLDADAWRGLSAGLDASLSLEAGLEIDFSANLSLSAGIGFSAGIELGASISLEASFGLEASVGGSLAAGLAGSFDQKAVGMALSAAGGVGAAVESVQIIRTENAVAKARAAFEAPTPAVTPAAPAASRGAAPSGRALPPPPRSSLAVAGSSTPRPMRPDQPRAPMKTQADPAVASHAPSIAAPRPPAADRRATSFGFGVPLRPRAGDASASVGSAQNRAVIAPRARDSGAPAPRDPTLPPWAMLPAPRPDRGATKGGLQRGGRSQSPCGCVSPCRCRGARGGRT